MDDEIQTVDVHPVLGGDFVLHYRDPGVGGIQDDDYAVVLRTGTADPGQVVVIVDSDNTASLRIYESEMVIVGRVTGLMRRLA